MISLVSAQDGRSDDRPSLHRIMDLGQGQYGFPARRSKKNSTEVPGAGVFQRKIGLSSFVETL